MITVEESSAPVPEQIVLGRIGVCVFSCNHAFLLQTQDVSVWGQSGGWFTGVLVCVIDLCHRTVDTHAVVGFLLTS